MLVGLRGLKLSQMMVFGRDWSEFAKQGVAGTVCSPRLRTQACPHGAFLSGQVACVFS